MWKGQTCVELNIRGNCYKWCKTKDLWKNHLLDTSSLGVLHVDSGQQFKKCINPNEILILKIKGVDDFKQKKRNIDRSKHWFWLVNTEGS